ncbi:MAG: prepilin-type N-terminal cleavage/methylation domain-containing protein, partial [Clostridia bacterium]|nr:prepilin-type N-terminal cleavage/methylation domain-containing protein [Clostridia bacterium]
GCMSACTFLERRREKIWKKRNERKRREGAEKALGDKRGFTLVELLVVLALLAILTAMIVSFSVLVSGYAKESRAAADYTEDCTVAKEAILSWVKSENVSEIAFAEGVLTLGAEARSGLETIRSISFDQSEKLLKCTLEPREETFDPYVFVVFVRSNAPSEEVSP